MSNDPVILYVEDDPESREVMRLLMAHAGLSHITIFEDSANFLERVQALTAKPDVILLDIHVQPYDGFEMLEMLRQVESSGAVPVVALTASVMNEEIHKLKAAGFHSVIAKPIDMDTFPDILDRILNGEVIWRIVG